MLDFCSKTKKEAQLVLLRKLLPIQKKDVRNKMRSIKRGDIFYAALNPVIGSEQGERRPLLQYILRSQARYPAVSVFVSSQTVKTESDWFDVATLD
jgi:hypothetical protein